MQVMGLHSSGAPIATTHQYLADQYVINIGGTSVSVDYDTNQTTTAQAIADAINGDATVAQCGCDCKCCLYRQW